jgi:negative regulator of flagellin synthesis FlgM
MKISSSNRAPDSTVSTLPVARSTKPASQSQTSDRDSVRLSSLSSRIQSLEASLGKASDFDSAKVEAIRQTLSEGRFSSDPEVIANKLIASTVELLSHQRN